MTQRSLTPICTRYNIAALYAFGSRAAEVVAWLRGEIVRSFPRSSVGMPPPTLQRREFSGRT